VLRIEMLIQVLLKLRPSTDCERKGSAAWIDGSSVNAAR
jgi:hypothetical protein